ncbi:unnamed protein product [Dovyalis caffra]|uniref:CTLH domain-containing protein n=1 Tax=Dovyalis caffra TaxID=77055 RepID=A0AAV1S535_9ROSI|nr:unnamed protein product [Dovyalis caffra]
MSSLSRELVFLILQFLEEEKFKETVHRLEQESGFYFNMRYFEEMVTNGEWDEVEKYLSGFTKVDDNRYSMKIFFEIRKQKYLEALDKRDRAKAVEILVKDLKVFAAFNEELFKEITQLLTDNEQLSKYGDTKSARGIMLGELKKLIEANPLFRDKLQFPTLKNSRLRTLINQSLNWQHQLCKNPRPNPDIKTLFVDHSCGQPNGARAPSPVTNSLMGAVPKAGGFPPITGHGPFQPTPAIPSSLAGWMANPSAVPHPSASAGPIGLAAPNNAAALLKRPRTPPTNNSAIDYQTADSEHVLKRSRPFGLSDEVNNLPVNVLPIAYPSQNHGQSSYSSDDLPKNPVMALTQSSAAKSMDFHPVHQILLLVGTNMGDVMLWELGSREMVAQRNFKVWDLNQRSRALQASLSNDYAASVNRVAWSPDGNLFGVAYSKHIMHVYSYHGGDDIRNHLEIDAHNGNVNDLAFSYPNKQLAVVTCGDDRTIRVWDAVVGTRLFNFQGHDAPVYSVCPHHKENIQFIFSTATDGKIKAWLYDHMGSRVDYDAPGHSSTTMAYSADGTRLFSCGTNKEGESHLVEWNESEGAVKRAYNGLAKRSAGVVKFDTTKNRFLAAGDEFTIKFWDMDNVNILTSIDAEGGLPASPCIRFNKEGTLLAVATKDNSIKILANSDGMRLLRTVESRTFDASRAASAAVVKGPTMGNFPPANATVGTSIDDQAAPVAPMVGMVGVTRPARSSDSRSLVDVKPKIQDESVEKSRIWKLTEINDSSQCRSLRLPDSLTAMRLKFYAFEIVLYVMSLKLKDLLIYTNSGVAILALASNAVHKLWKWQRNDRNLAGKATANVPPQLWQPSSGILMTNEISDTNPEDAVPCFALSKNDSYVMSASGGKISLFNMMTFKTMTTFMATPPAATFLAFHPQDNNIIAIGMEDSSIQIYNVRVDEVKTKLKGHQKRITGLAFSHSLNVLVSSGADSQLCVWSTDAWEKQTSKLLQIPSGRPAPSLADTRVQFHIDQIHLLAVHETQIAIYVAPKLECLKPWFPPEASGPITHATYSCDSQSIYVSFEDGSVGVLTASTLRLRCRINSTAYLPPNPSLRVYPLVIAAHPTEPDQFALGLTDGGVHVLEPSDSEGKWGTSPPVENGAGPSTTSGAAGPEQPQSPAPWAHHNVIFEGKLWKLDCKISNLQMEINSKPAKEKERGGGEMLETVMALTQGSAANSMDFHPVQQILLLVGTNMGDVMLWELGSRERVAWKNFKAWDLNQCSRALQASLSNDYAASVNRVAWSPDGNLFGVAYSKHIMHVYSYHGGDDIRNHLEIDAHNGNVNDLAFSYPNKQLAVVTCGNDRTIRVWDAVVGTKLFNFQGHFAPVYSVCPHHKENIQFIFSTAIDGKIKAWLYDHMGSRVDYDAPGHSSTTMAYSADGTRLFSCGTNKVGESHLVEWNESDGTVKRAYNGLAKRSAAFIDAEGGLPASPCIRFNKDGTLLAVSTNDNSIKILANSDGMRLLRTVESLTFDASRAASTAVVKGPTMGNFPPANATVGTSIDDQAAPAAPVVGMVGVTRPARVISFMLLIVTVRSLVDVKPKIQDESVEKSRIWKLTEINDSSQCRSLRLPDSLTAMRVSRLIYTNSGVAILALASNAVHKLWKWQRNDRNLAGKVCALKLLDFPCWNGILMTNEISDTNPEDAVPCFALSKNNSYVMSASGGKISLFNMMTFKPMTTFMAPPPAATFLAFHPQDNNIIAIGMEDSSIQMYNVRVDEVKTKLKGHQKRITGLAFSHSLNVLVSFGADSQLCVWSTDAWEKQTSKLLQIPSGRPAPSLADTRVQFHIDQIHLLAVHETQIAIYEVPKLECRKLVGFVSTNTTWFPPEASGPITHATYSCDSQSIYVSFEDGSVGVLTASTLRLRCRINSTAYLPPNPSLRVYPLVIAAHPTEPDQFALGLTDGGVHVLEPSDSEGKWGTSPPVENGAGPDPAPWAHHNVIFEGKLWKLGTIGLAYLQSSVIILLPEA